MEQAIHLAEALATTIVAQFAHLFLRAGSTFSLPMLVVTLAIFVVLAVPRGRAIRPRVLARALFPHRLFHSASGRTDLAYALAGATVMGLAIGWALLGAEQVRLAVQPWLGQPWQPRLPPPAAHAIATVTLFVAYEFAYWFDHRLKHTVPALWHFHKVHHQAESLSLLTNFRVHPVDTAIYLNIVAVTLGATQAMLQVMLGTDATPLAIGGTNALVWATAVGLSHLQHSHLWVTFGPRWGRWFLSPAHHQVHHSREARHYNRNYGDVLAIFDRLFGTLWIPAATREVTRFGVEDGEPAPHDWRAAFLQPFRDAARDIARPVARRTRRTTPEAG